MLPLSPLPETHSQRQTLSIRSFADTLLQNYDRLFAVFVSAVRFCGFDCLVRDLDLRRPRFMHKLFENVDFEHKDTRV